MTSHYYQQLDQASKDRYLDKLSFNGIVLPDPLDEAIRSYAFSPSVNLWPPVSFGDVYLYLVHNVCFYTQQEFKSYKALDSYNYVFSGKVKNIVTFRNTTVNVSVLTRDVQASQTLKNVHRPWVITSNDGVVYSAHCTCMAGLGEACSHIGALLFALEVFARVGPPSSTSLPCQWNKCSKKVEPLAVSDIQFNHSRENPNEKPSIDFQMPSASAFNSFLRVIQETSPDAPILKMLSDSEETSTADEAEVEIKKQEQSLIGTFQNLMQFCESFYKNLPSNLTTAQKVDLIFENCTFPPVYIKEVERLTRPQYKTILWEHCRRGRITASMFGRVLRCGAKGRKKLINTIIKHTPYTNKAMEYGQKSEDLAKEKLREFLEETHVNAEVLPTGFLIDQKYGFLGASPDGMVICDCCDSALVEVKSTYKGRNLKIKDIEKKNFFLNDALCLKENHNFYDQIQGQMDIWNISVKCYFVTFTNVDVHFQVIDYDREYWSPRKSNLIAFFKEYVLNEILKQF